MHADVVDLVDDTLAWLELERLKSDAVFTEMTRVAEEFLNGLTTSMADASCLNWMPVTDDAPPTPCLATALEGKQRITIRIDRKVLAAFRREAAATGVPYQTLLNRTLLESLDDAPATKEDASGAPDQSSM